MPSQRIGALLAAVMLSAATPALAEAKPQTLTLLAASTAEAAFVVTKPLVFDPARASMAGTGRVRGFVINREAPGGSLVTAEVRVARWDTPTGPLRVSSTAPGTVTLSPGRYRLVVYGQRQTKITIPLASGNGTTVTATSKTQARAEVIDLLQGRPVVSPSVSVRVTYPGTVLLAQTYFRARAHQAEAVAQCFARAADQAEVCVNRPGFTGAITSPGSVGDGHTSQFAAAYGSDFPTGEQIDVLLQAADVDAPAFAEWLILTA